MHLSIYFTKEYQYYNILHMTSLMNCVQLQTKLPPSTSGMMAKRMLIFLFTNTWINFLISGAHDHPLHENVHSEPKECKYLGTFLREMKQEPLYKEHY